MPTPCTVHPAVQADAEGPTKPVALVDLMSTADEGLTPYYMSAIATPQACPKIHGKRLSVPPACLPWPMSVIVLCCVLCCAVCVWYRAPAPLHRLFDKAACLGCKQAVSLLGGGG